MKDAIAMLFSVLLASWQVLLESSPYVLLGFFVAGLIKAFLSDNFVSVHLGGRGIGSILKAAALGVPIPLCSCGVLPAAAGLKKQGAGSGAVAAFLISTPETGVDSIAVSYALLDPLMTVFRPVVAFFTAVAAGIAVSLSEGEKNGHGGSNEPEQAASCSSSCCCSSKKQEKPKEKSVVEKFRHGMSFAFGDLLKDVGLWLFIGILLAGMISVFVSPELVSRYFSNDYLSMLMMLAISVPLYVCATASTPIAAALALKGISPGAALVFLLAGPATNAASLTVISRMLGKKATIVYLLAIVVMSLLAGVLVNALYGYLGFDIRHWVQKSTHEEGGILSIAASLVLIGLVLKSFFPAKHDCC